MKFDYLETFIQTAKLGSLSKAARKLHLSQSAVSLQLKQLEREHNVRLIDRDNHKFRITDEGKLFLRFAELAVKEHRNVLLKLAQMSEGISGDLQIICPPLIGEFLLSPILIDYKKQNPSIDINLTIGDSLKIMEETSRVDRIIGFCTGLPGNQNLECIKIMENEVVLAVYPGHPLANQKEISASDFLGESIILLAHPMAKKRRCRDALTAVGFDLDRHQPKLILGSGMGLISAVESGTGIAVISDLATKRSESLGLIKTVKIAGVNLKIETYCIYQKRTLTFPLYKNFLEFLLTKTPVCQD